MPQFQATVVEVSSTEEGTLMIHFDDEQDQYLQIQTSEDSDGFEEGFGNVYVEVNDQINAGTNCFSQAELSRTRFRLVLDRDPDMTKIGEMIVTFELEDAEFDELKDGLSQAFQDFTNFVVE